MIDIIEYPTLKADHYLELLPPESAAELTAVADRFRDSRVIHINSTAYGGGVAEILHSLVPLSNALGISTQRAVITPRDARFFDVTKRIHNMLQGAAGGLTEEELAIYYGCLDDIGAEIDEAGLSAEVWFFHDPQLLPLARLLDRGAAPTRLWVVHIDLTDPNPWLMERLLPLTRAYDLLICSLEDYVPRDAPGDLGIFVAPPAIDPFAPKNCEMPRHKAADIAKALGIDVSRPLVTQVSRFDLWKDPWGVIDAYRLAKRSHPDLQLALLGLSQANDDPEGEQVLRSVTEHSDNDPDIHMFFFPNDLPASNDEIVNALQTHSRVLVQKSTREGFGLTVSEGMWKGKPMIGGNVGGIRLQIVDGESGYLVDDATQAGERIAQLLADNELCARIGRNARDRVRQRFLIPRLLNDYLRATQQARSVAPQPVC